MSKFKLLGSASRRFFSGGGHSSANFHNKRLNEIIAYSAVAGTVLGTTYYAKQNAGMAQDAWKRFFPPTPPNNNRAIDGKGYTRHIDAPKKSNLQSSRLINTFGINLSSGNNQSRFTLIKGNPNTGKSFLRDVIVNHNSEEAIKYGMQITNLTIRCHNDEQYKADIKAVANLLNCFPKKEPESDQDYLSLVHEIVRQCKLRGGMVNLNFISARNKFDEDGDLDLSLFNAFFPKYESPIFHNSGLKGRGKIMDNVNVVFTSGDDKVIEYLEKLGFQTFNTCSHNPEDIRFLRDDFYVIVENERFKNLREKLTEVPTDLVDVLMAKLIGNSLLLEMATNYLNHPQSESFVEFLDDVILKTKDRDIAEVLLEKNLNLIRKMTADFLWEQKGDAQTGIDDDQIVNIVLSCLYKQHKDPQDRISKEESRLRFYEFLNDRLGENADFKPYVLAYNFVVAEAEKLLLVRPNRDGKSWLVIKPDLMDKLIGREKIKGEDTKSKTPSPSVLSTEVRQAVEAAIGLSTA